MAREPWLDAFSDSFTVGRGSRAAPIPSAPHPLTTPVEAAPHLLTSSAEFAPHPPDIRGRRTLEKGRAPTTVYPRPSSGMAPYPTCSDPSAANCLRTPSCVQCCGCLRVVECWWCGRALHARGDGPLCGVRFAVCGVRCASDK